MKNILLILTALFFFSFDTIRDERTKYFPRSVEKVDVIPDKNNTWVFILAGQSNMAGRALVEPQDTIPNKRILTINSNGELIIAKEPLHFYEPASSGLDCGLSFGKKLLLQIPDNISIVLIPAAVGGSCIQKWLGDSLQRNVKLLSNFKEKVLIGNKYGDIKAILWHQGEDDASPDNSPFYQDRLKQLFKTFRKIVNKNDLPILVGELGSFAKENEKEQWQLINKAIRSYAAEDIHTSIISTQDLTSKDDSTHFNSASQRIMGERFAEEYFNENLGRSVWEKDWLLFLIAGLSIYSAFTLYRHKLRKNKS